MVWHKYMSSLIEVRKTAISGELGNIAMSNEGILLLE